MSLFLHFPITFLLVAAAVQTSTFSKFPINSVKYYAQNNYFQNKFISLRRVTDAQNPNWKILINIKILIIAIFTKLNFFFQIFKKKSEL